MLDYDKIKQELSTLVEVTYNEDGSIKWWFPLDIALADKGLACFIDRNKQEAYEQQNKRLIEQEVNMWYKEYNNLNKSSYVNTRRD